MPKIEFNDLANYLDTLKSRYPMYVSPKSKEYVELHELIDGLCVLYLDASEDQRARMRSLVAELPRDLRGQLLHHIGWATGRLLSSNDEEYIRRALAAASLDDNHSDSRDTYMALGHLYLAASSVGINCSCHFLEAAELSSTQPGLLPKLGSMRDFLAGFERSAYFNEDVRPKISRYETPRIRAEILNVLADIWDPLDVKNGRYPRKEYDSFIHDIYELLAKDATDAKITEHLCKIARLRMQMEPPLSTPDAVRALRAIKLGENKT
jgi:hypothetical protein